MARTKLRLKPAFYKQEVMRILKPGARTIALANIRPREHGDARHLLASHVVTLAESMAVLGILEPPVVDTRGRLLAGGHRLAALQMLARLLNKDRRDNFLKRLLINGESPLLEDAPLPIAVAELADRVAKLNAIGFTGRYPTGAIPVVVVDVSGKDRAAQSLAVEAAENGVRRQYSRAEVRELAAKLQAAGYISRNGRPKKGERSARPVLEILLGCSGRHLARLLGEDDRPKFSEWDLAVKALARAVARIKEEGKGRRNADDLKMIQEATKLGRLLSQNKPRQMSLFPDQG